MARNFTYIGGIVAGTVAAHDRPLSKGADGVPHRIYNLGNHRPKKFLDFIAVLERLLTANEAMKVRMTLGGFDPAMQHCDNTHLGAEITIDADGPRRLSRRSEQDRIDRRLVWKAIAATDAGPAKTTRKGGTGNSSACRSASRVERASPR
jgi:hypothetical protein